jgi:hypothetical protein
MRESKAWQAARKLPKGPPGSQARKARAKAFEEICAAYGFISRDIQRFAQQCRDACWIKDHVGGHGTQTTSLRAFRAVEQYIFGKRGRPRFRRFNEFNSVEGKEAKSTIIFRDNAVTCGGLRLPAILDPFRCVAGRCPQGATKYCRIDSNRTPTPARRPMRFATRRCGAFLDQLDAFAGTSAAAPVGTVARLMNQLHRSRYSSSAARGPLSSVARRRQFPAEVFYEPRVLSLSYRVSRQSSIHQ